MTGITRRRTLFGLAAFAASAAGRADLLGDFAKQAMQQTGGQSAIASSLSNSDIAKGLKEALAKGTRNAVSALGQSGGFWNDQRFRIPLPGPLEKAGGFLRAAGAGASLDELHLAMNSAAEKAVPVAANVFSGAVQKLTLDDVRNILGGPPDAATQFFRRNTGETLATQFKPIVAGITAKAGLVRRYQGVLASAGPLAASFGAPDLDDFVTRKALDGLFLRVGDEEKNIRENPAARTSAILKKVFAR
jgi:hypothetical protein